MIQHSSSLESPQPETIEQCSSSLLWFVQFTQLTCSARGLAGDEDVEGGEGVHERALPDVGEVSAGGPVDLVLAVGVEARVVHPHRLPVQPARAADPAPRRRRRRLGGSLGLVHA